MRSSADHFLSTSAASFLPLHRHQRSNMLFRETESQAEVEAKDRQLKRNARFARAELNLATSLAYRELEDLSSKMVQLRRNERKSVSALQYETKMFIEDMKLCEKQPGIRMSRRPNTALATSMWGGNPNLLAPSNSA